MKILLPTVLILFGLQFAQGKDPAQKISLQVTENGFEPNEIKVKRGSHVILKINRKTETTCATQIVMKERAIKVDLPLNKDISVDLGILKKGDIRFACGMDMISGHIIAE